jgi:NAD(P)-dependent dehydrogenase (short-subunit alcohol dehydrogenase family)
MGVGCDVADRSAVEAVARRAVGRFGRIDVLVNNAGVCPFVDAMGMSPEVFARTIEVNLAGPFHCTQVVARHMIERGAGGVIIFITSLNENFTNASQLDYASSKGGLRMQMKAFCLALGAHGIRCNAVAPGMILTDMTRSHWEKPANAAYIRRRVPVGRIGTPRDIGEVCAFLASDAARYVSGTTITVDGGYTASCP